MAFAYIVTVLIWIAAVDFTTGFLCYECSYSIWSDGNRRDCITDPAAVHVAGQCNATSYCVLSEIYDLQRKSVTSYFRTCLGVSKDTICQIDASHVQCYVSCKGTYCNAAENGTRYKVYLEQFPGGDPTRGNGASRLFQSVNWATFVSLATILTILYYN